MRYFGRKLAVGGAALAMGLSSCNYDVGKYAEDIQNAHWYRVQNTSGTVWRGYTGENTNKTQLHWAEYQDRVCEKNKVENVNKLGESVLLPDVDKDGKVAGEKVR
jgi:hypothetical protein